MARPLPKDLERQIADTAKKRELVSVAVFGFMVGTAFGAGLMAAISGTDSNNGGLWLFAGLALCLVGYVWLARRKQK